MAARERAGDSLTERDRPIRVLQIMEATIGGTKRHLFDLVTGLDQAEFSVDVACPTVRSEARGDISFVEDLQGAGASVRLVPMVRAIHPLADARTTAALARLIWSGRYDLVHTHSTKAGLTGRLAAASRPTMPLVHTPHGFYYLNFESRARRGLFRLIERALTVRTSVVITLSDSERTEAESLLPASKIRLVPNSFDAFEPLSRDEARARLRLPLDVPIVGTTTRFTQQKSPFDIVEAFAEIHRARPDVRFLWINDGELREEVERRLESRRLLEVTARPGYLADARRYLPAMDVVLHLARWEGVPYSVMEAMTARVPVVGARAIGTIDLIDHEATGLLVDPGDGPAAGRAALRLLTRPDLARTISRAACAAVRARHGSAAMVRATEDIYRELMRTG